MAPRGYFTTGSLSAFIFLGIVRGSFSVTIYFAVRSYKSPSLAFLLRTPGSVVLYTVLMIFLSLRDSEVKETFYYNFRTVRNYWKFAVMGLIQLAAPYLLFLYALQVLNPTTAGVYMAAAPWISILLERLPFVRSSHPISAGKVGAIAVGIIGIVLVSITGIALAKNTTNCYWEVKVYGANHTGMQATVFHTNETSPNKSITDIPSLEKLHCPSFTHVEVAMSLLALIGGSLMWSISSVFWRSNRGNIHYVSGGIANNIFGGIFALILWLILRRYNNVDEVSWWNDSAVLSVLFLTVMSGWLAAIIVDYLYKEIGALVTSRVLCLVPLVAWFEDWMFVRKFKVLDMYWWIPVEVVGVVLMFVGLTLSHLEPENLASTLHRPLLSSEERERAVTDQFYSNVRGSDDGMSEDEVKNISYLRSCSTNSTQDSFPPLVEVQRQDQQ